MKYDIVRSCKHTERVKVYERDPHDPRKSQEHTERILRLESWKRCQQCSKHRVDK